MAQTERLRQRNYITQPPGIVKERLSKDIRYQSNLKILKKSIEVRQTERSNLEVGASPQKSIVLYQIDKGII